MKFIRVLFAGVLTLMLGNAQAALLDRGSGLIYDSDLNITWLQNAALMPSLDWGQAMSYAANLSYYDSVRDVTYTDWRLPTSNFCSGYSNCASTELGHLFYTELAGTDGTGIAVSHNSNYNLFVGMGYNSFWFGAEQLGNAYYMDFGSGRNDTHDVSYSFYNMYAWAVRNGDVASVAAPIAVVPEPETYAMLLAGLGVLGFMARRRKNITA